VSSFGPPPPQFDLYYAAIDKQTGQTAAVGMSAPGVLADASEKTGLPKDCFELRQISREEYGEDDEGGRAFTLSGFLRISPPNPR
jgi:hypothetical protein